jgi:hypothetical protein
MAAASEAGIVQKILKWLMSIGIVLAALILAVILWILFFSKEVPLAPPTSTPIATYTPTHTPTPTPTQTPVPTTTPTATPSPMPTLIPGIIPPPVVRYGSNGLGLSQADWEAAHSVTGLGATLGQTQATVYDGVFAVLFINGNVGWIDRAWTAGSGVTGAEALALGESLAPLDRQPVRNYAPTQLPGATVSIYYSPTLADCFPAELWGAELPGTFAIVTIANGEEIVRLLLLLGDPAAVLG